MCGYPFVEGEQLAVALRVGVAVVGAEVVLCARLRGSVLMSLAASGLHVHSRPQRAACRILCHPAGS